MVVVDMEEARRKANGRLKSTSAMNFLGAPPGRAFLDYASLMPMRNVTILGGDGGTGKSLVATQLAIAVVSGTLWIGIEVQHGPVLYLSAEDDEAEIHNRFHEICEAEGISKHEAGAGLEFVLMAGEDAVMASEDKRTTRMVKLPLYEALDRLMAEIGPILLVLDNLADVYSGNENSRTLSKQFIGFLRGLAIKHDCVVLLLAHPSLKGIEDDTGTSGSTAWNNSVRSRMYLKRVLNGDRTEDNENARELQTMKSNYSAKGEPIPLMWEGHRFVRSEKARLFDGTPSDIVERVQDLVRNGDYRTDQQSRDWLGYAVAAMLDRDVGEGLKAGEQSGKQKQERSKISRMIHQWVRNHRLCKVKKMDAHRDLREFYEVAAPEG